MPKGILVGTDLSQRSALAFARAHGLAAASGCRLALIHVADPDLTPEPAEEMIRHAHARMSVMAREAGPPFAEAIVTAGDAYEAILETAAARGDDLIVLGAARPRRLLASFSGTTVERVIRGGNRPVLMVCRSPEGPYARIVAATDLSDAAADAIRAAAGLGLLAGAQVTLAHAYQPIVEHLAGYGGMRMEDIAREKSAEASRLRRRLTAFVRRLGPLDVHFRKVLLEGPAAESLIALVAHERADLIVLGTRGLSGIRRFVLGSVAASVLADPPCDVLAVPPAG